MDPGIDHVHVGKGSDDSLDRFPCDQVAQRIQIELAADRWVVAYRFYSVCGRFDRTLA